MKFKTVKCALTSAAVFGLIGTMGLGTVPALAEYPKKPIRMIVGFSAGGGTDSLARSIASFIHEEIDSAHVRAEPTFIVIGRAGLALRCAGWRKGCLGREMRLADKCDVVARFAHFPGEALFADFRIEIDTVIDNAMGERQHAGENGRARRLAHGVGVEAILEMGAGGG